MSIQTEAKAFIQANDRSPVVEGRAIGNGGEGAIYILDDGKTFTLSRDVCRALPDSYPKWKLA